MHPDLSRFWDRRQPEQAMSMVRRLVPVEPKVPAKPVRDTVIGSEDVLNLRIALGSAKTLDEFLEMT